MCADFTLPLPLLTLKTLHTCVTHLNIPVTHFHNHLCFVDLSHLCIIPI